jgi:hypothetical protein
MTSTTDSLALAVAGVTDAVKATGVRPDCVVGATIDIDRYRDGAVFVGTRLEVVEVVQRVDGYT